jgi:hypothetical protein
MRVMRTVYKRDKPWFIALPNNGDVKDADGKTVWFRTRAEAAEERARLMGGGAPVLTSTS